MDRFDRIAIAAVAVLTAGTLILMQGHTREAKPVRSAKQRTTAGESPAAGAELAGGIRLARNLIEGGNLARAESLVQELKQKHRYEGELAMLMGDLFMRKQEPVRAMYEYKEAIELNPDYLDKKTPLFQGKKMKVAVGEALAEIENRLRKNPGDEALKREKKVIYYLYRRIAGSCG